MIFSARFAFSDSSPKAERNLSSVGEFAREGELERRGEEISTGFPDFVPVIRTSAICLALSAFSASSARSLARCLMRLFIERTNTNTNTMNDEQTERSIHDADIIPAMRIACLQPKWLRRSSENFEEKERTDTSLQHTCNKMRLIQQYDSR